MQMVSLSQSTRVTVHLLYPLCFDLRRTTILRALFQQDLHLRRKNQGSFVAGPTPTNRTLGNRAASGKSRLPVPQPASTTVGRGLAATCGSRDDSSKCAIALIDSRFRSPRSVPARILVATPHGSQPGGKRSQSMSCWPHGSGSASFLCAFCSSLSRRARCRCFCRAWCSR